MVTVASIVAAAVLATACGAGGDVAGVDSCGERPLVVGDGEPVDGTLAIGVRRDGVFEPVAEQGDFELIQGAQGGWMVVPMLRVESASAGDDFDCAWVSLQVEVVGGDVMIEHVEPVGFERRGSSFHSDDLFAFLSLDLSDVESRSAVLRAVVDVGEQSAQETLRATLVNEN